MACWIVFECRNGQKMAWAWGLVNEGPGFDRVEFTDSSGCDPAELTEIPELTRYLFQVPAVAERGPVHATGRRPPDPGP